MSYVISVLEFAVHLTFLLVKSHFPHNLKDKEREKLLRFVGKRTNNLSELSHNFCYCPEMCNTMDYSVEITESDYDWPRKMAALGIDVTKDDEG